MLGLISYQKMEYEKDDFGCHQLGMAIVLPPKHVI